MISRLGMLTPLVDVLVWADRKLNIGGRGGMVSAAGPQMDCSRRGHRQPGFRLTGVRRAPHRIRGAAEKADIGRNVLPFFRAIGYTARGGAMPGAGTDKTKRWREGPGPVVILVEPQLGENIGAVARAMANFGLSRLRLVGPREGRADEKGGADGGRGRPRRAH